MSFVGHGWRSGQASDITGSAATPTVSGIAPTTYARKNVITLTVTGTGFTAQSVIYAEYNPCATTYDSATQLRCTSFNTTPDNGLAGVIDMGVRNPGQVISGTRPFTAT
jgi:IPT/TIG domain